MKTTVQILTLFLALFAFSIPATAQYDVPYGVVPNGAGVSQDGHIVKCSVGQLAIGNSSGASNVCKHGFWHVAEIAYTSDVAIALLWGEYREDVVVLHWHAQSDGLFQGFRIYRGRGDTEAFVQINDDLISPASNCTYTDSDVMPGTTYRYRIGAVQGDDEYFSVDLTLSLAPKPLTLYQNFPNPFNPLTSIRCFMPEESEATLEIFDVSGKRVATLVEREKLKGFFLANWNGKDTNGNRVSSGVYFYRLKAGKKALTKKMVVMR